MAERHFSTTQSQTGPRSKWPVSSTRDAKSRIGAGEGESYHSRLLSGSDEKVFVTHSITGPESRKRNA